MKTIYIIVKVSTGEPGGCAYTKYETAFKAWKMLGEAAQNLNAYYIKSLDVINE